MNDRTDADLIAAWCGHRDEDAFQILVDRHGPLVHATARRRLDDPENAPDVAGRAFALLAGRPDRAPADRLAGWLAKVAIHLAETENRTARRRQARERRAVVHAPSAPTMTPHAEDLALRIDEIVSRLRPDERECMLLHVAEGLDHGQVASRLGLTEAAARMRTHRALERIRRKLGVSSAAALAAWRPPSLSTSERDRLMRSALAPKGATAGGSAALGWLLMTKLQKSAIGLAALLLLLGAGSAALHGRPASPTGSGKLEASAFVGRWKGTLTYVVRRTGRRVAMPVTALVDATARGMRLRVRYADPGWGVDASVETSPDGRRLVITDKGQRQDYRLLAAGPGRLVGERHVDEPGRPADQRITLLRSGDRLSYLTEERLEGRDWTFANEYALETR